MKDAAPRGGRAAVSGALLLVQLFFGLHYLAAKLVLAEIPPRAWAGIRVVAAAAVLLVLVSALRVPLRFSRGDLGRLAAYSLFGVVINQVCFVEGLYRTTPTHSAIINTTIPVGTLLFAVAMGRERLDRWKLASLLVAIAGVMLVIRPERASGVSSTLAGDLLTVANALSYSLFLVLSKRLLSRADPLAATAVLMAFGAGGILVVSGPEIARFRPASVDWTTWGLAAFVVLFATVAAYYLNYWALARVDPSTVALFIYLQPLVAASLAAAWLGERPGPHVLLGGALVFAGVYLAIGPRRAGARDAAALEEG